MTRIVELPAAQIEFELLGVLVRFGLDARFVMVGLSGALAAIGSEWVMESHPISNIRRPGLQSRLLPGLAALAAGAVLPLIPLGPIWVAGLALAGVLNLAVLLAEFVVLDREDRRAPVAEAAIRLLSMLIVVGVAFAARANESRAIFVIPAIFVVVSLVGWRAIGLSIRRSRYWPYALAGGLLAAQLAWGLHYWPVSPAQLALLIGLTTYLGTGLGIAQLRGELRPRLLYEYGGVALATLVLVVLVA